MSGTSLETALAQLTEIQQRAVTWTDGALLVLAGPGSGKTQVLTSRIAVLLDSSQDKHFRVLALTFTNKAADEMRARVETFVPNLVERANIGTFHSFCTQVLRQHGVHLGIKPDFIIYSQDSDRKALLEDALQAAAERGDAVGVDDARYLSVIDRLKARLIEPERVPSVLQRYDQADRLALIYRLYEDELKRLNALDFNSLIFDSYRLAIQFPALIARYRRTYAYWLLDEFQDTNVAQYRLLKAFAGPDFRNLFAVADDDQIIYRWNGASFKNIQSFLSDFSAQLVQLPTNYRCPPSIVDAANRLVAYNAERTADKRPLLAGKTNLRFPVEEHIQLREFETDADEAEGIAREIAEKGAQEWSKTAIIARTRAILERMRDALEQKGVPSVLVQRRDDFLSPEMRWLVACLTQVSRPLDKRVCVTLVDAFNRLSGHELNADQIIADAEASGRGYLQTWLGSVRSENDSSIASLVDPISTLIDAPADFRTTIATLTDSFKAMVTSAPDERADLSEDLIAWRELVADITRGAGRNISLDQFLQELQLRSKEPSVKSDTVTLTTVHAAKGLEFELVYLVGLAEDVMPSFQSRSKGDLSPEMEEERRNCFVAITRAKERLVLSRANRYRGWQKAPSRFLVEMGFVKRAA
jgi:DNA helicase-2/ATP-dependent DNA helicase PcrA